MAALVRLDVMFDAGALNITETLVSLLEQQYILNNLLLAVIEAHEFDNTPSEPKECGNCGHVDWSPGDE